jgi:HAD superfamily hydrolase (TIGR01509 family)
MIPNLIWDLDGTLFDTYPSIVEAFRQAIRAHGQAAGPARVESLCKVGLAYCSQQLANDFGLDGQALEDEFAALYAAIPKGAQPPFQGVYSVCESIVSRGGTNSIATHRRRSSTLELLSIHGLAHLFAEIVTADDGLPKKPDPAAFLRILGRLSLDPAATAAIGDREIDVIAGKAAGLSTCLFRGDAGLTQADFVFDDYADLLRHLEAS